MKCPAVHPELGWKCPFYEAMGPPVLEKRVFLTSLILKPAKILANSLKAFGCMLVEEHSPAPVNSGANENELTSSGPQQTDQSHTWWCGLPSASLSNNFHAPFVSRARSAVSLLVLSAESINEEGKYEQPLWRDRMLPAGYCAAIKQLVSHPSMTEMAGWNRSNAS